MIQKNGEKCCARCVYWEPWGDVLYEGVCTDTTQEEELALITLGSENCDAFLGRYLAIVFEETDED